MILNAATFNSPRSKIHEEAQPPYRCDGGDNHSNLDHQNLDEVQVEAAVADFGLAPGDLAEGDGDAKEGEDAGDDDIADDAGFFLLVIHHALAGGACTWRPSRRRGGPGGVPPGATGASASRIAERVGATKMCPHGQETLCPATRAFHKSSTEQLGHLK